MAISRVEIAICTYNRANLLEATLQRFIELREKWSSALESSWRVIVVDNNSTDRTQDVLNAAKVNLDLEVATEKQQGHVHARNRAIELAEGDLLLWTDDDVLVDENWPAEYEQAANSEPEIDFWGSKIVPRFPNNLPPKWISENWDKLSGCFADKNLGDNVIELDSGRLPYGANFAIRTEVQRQCRFDPGLGRTDSLVVGDDEIKLFRRLLDNGHKGQWIPNASVDHMIDQNRLSAAYVAKYFEGQGRTLVAKNQAWTNDLNSLYREAKHELFWSTVKRFFVRSEVWVSHLIRGSLAKGQWQALRAKS